MKKLFLFLLISICSGCITVNLGDSEDNKETKKESKTEVMLANPLNVYKTSSNMVIKALIKNKRGKWVEAEKDVLIPSGWFIINGTEIE